MAIKAIVCIGANGVMGNKGFMPWGTEPLDGKHFQNLTKGHAVLMGRKTFDSIGKPLPNRVNIVLSKKFVENTHRLDWEYGQLYVHDSWLRALETYCAHHSDKDLWVIGGAMVFQQFMPFIEEFYVTTVGDTFEGDTYLPNIHEKYRWEGRLLHTERIAYLKDSFTMTDIMKEPSRKIDHAEYTLTYRVFKKELEPHVTELLKPMYSGDTP